MIELIVRGMSCGPCARNVTSAVQGVDPAAQVDVDLDTKRVSITSEADPAGIAAAIEQAGYQVERQLA